jgi:hypothetical protein
MLSVLLCLIYRRIELLYSAHCTIDEVMHNICYALDTAIFYIIVRPKERQLTDYISASTQ